ncbi:helix-turn-helix transcriptional regulator [Actinoplanes sp. L3-i22]|uniref:helix-turn-helix domain-containing protein n=1 Tax=Actinoplanes sp. L3-i22 TaxID=2836373 RepID=UPI001C7830B7|nr:helix-turn-helix transcriptional regulator [Actinoplanes sp. L3-i22]BCY09776.1 hypothetical protein L3i22_048640 [Actinoplanes sp. L3-i22]
MQSTPPPPRRAPVLLALGAAVTLLILLALTLAYLASDGHSSDGTAHATPIPQATPTSPQAGTTSPPAAQSPSADLAVVSARCRERAGELAAARVVFDPRLTMELGRTDTVEAVVTYDRSLAPSVILPGHGNATAEPVLVTCEVYARLRGATDDFTIDQTDWVSQALFENGSARWAWRVTPRSGGAKELILELQPALKVLDQSNTNLVNPRGAIAPFTSSVDVAVPAGKSIASWVDWAGRIVPIASAVVGVVGTVAVMETRARRRRRRGGTELVIADAATALGDLRKLRIARDVDATDVARRLGVPLAAFRALEEGRKVPTLRNVCDYAAALDVDLVFRHGSGSDAAPPEEAPAR